MGIGKRLKKLPTVALGAKYSKYYRKNQVDPFTIFYSSHHGAGMLCGPYAIFRKMMESREFDRYDHVWQIDDPAECKQLKKEYGDWTNVSFVEKNSSGYFNALTRAKYIIVNNTLPFYFTKKPEQVYVNTWHGIPLKTLGYDVPDGKFTARNMTRNFLLTDYLISPCRFMTKIYLQSYKLGGIYTGKLIENGYPRNDLLFSTRRDDIIEKLINRGIAIDDKKKIILYAPTWKGASFDRADKDIARYDEFCDYLSEHIDTAQYQILIKPHPMVYKLLSEREKRSGRYIPQSIDTDELLSVTDVLVSDYSSIFFDFLLTDRPIIFYIPDMESYREYRGVYFGLHELPGPYSGDMGDIAEWINRAETLRGEYGSAYDKMKTWSCEFDDGNVAQKVIDAVFHSDESDCRIVTAEQSGGAAKKKMLVAGGSFAPGEHTEKVLQWLDGIDYDVYDVTLLIDDNGKCTDEILRVNDHVRVLCRNGLIPRGVISAFRAAAVNPERASTSQLLKMYRSDVIKRNYRRILGESRFDIVANFAGDCFEQALTTYNAGQSEVISEKSFNGWAAAFENAHGEWKCEKVVL